MRVCAATGYQPSAIAGRMMCEMPPAPKAGNQFSSTEKIRISSSPTQKPGIACPSIAKPLPMLSIQPPRCTADSTPSGTASAVENSNAESASWIVEGRRSSTSVSAGICQR